jgi:molecular chaperone DnaK (HSP70)
MAPMWQDGPRRLLLRLGIDFGTTRTVVAWCDRGNYPVVSFVDDAGDAFECFPSVVAEKDGELRYGFDAERVAKDPTWHVVRSFKRRLNDPSPEATIQVGSTQLRMVDLLAGFFGALADALRNHSNVARALSRKGPLEAFVAAPANAHSTQRFICLDAFRRAGFEVLGLLNEPSAAGFEYTHRHRNTLTSKKDQVVVYDIGGGTFDVSLLRMTGPLHEVLATSGINRLGGDDFDTVLVELALAKTKLARKAIPERAGRLLAEQCRQLKEQLHPTTRKVTIDLASCLGDAAPRAEIAVDVTEFYDRCMPLVDRTLAATSAVLGRVDEPEPEDSATLPSEVAGVYVVGGASALPLVGRALRDAFGKRVHRSPYPSAAAAIGLAIAADEKAGLTLSDRFSRVFGVFREANGGAEVTFDPIFSHDVSLPNGKSRTAVVERTYHAQHNVGHFRYVECAEVDHSGQPLGDMASFSDIYFPFDRELREKKTKLGSVDVRRFEQQGPLIRETYALSPHGIVEVRIENLDDHYEVAYRLSPTAGA